MVELERSLLTIELTNISHTLVGGYDARPYSSELDLWELPREQEVKGLWRWWFRTLCGGALWRANALRADIIRRKTVEVLGYTKNASKFMLSLDVCCNKTPYKYKWEDRKVSPGLIWPKLTNARGLQPIPPRLLQLTFGLEAKEKGMRMSCYEPSSLNLKINLRERPYANINNEERKVATWSLLLALLFGGIGAITRRGFGSLKINDIESSINLNLIKKIKAIYSIEREEKLENLLIDLLDEALEDTSGYLSLDTKDTGKDIPPFPVLSPEDCFKLGISRVSFPAHREIEDSLRRIGIADVDAMILLTVLGYAAMKISWKILNGKRFTEPGYSYNTWVLGLPRSARGTGYFLSDGHDEGRRISAIGIKPFSRLGSREWMVLRYGFLSQDWSMLCHKSRERSDCRPVPMDIQRAFNDAWKYVSEFLGDPHGI